MFATRIANAIWQMTFGGLFGGIAAAARAERNGNVIGGLITRASVYYSYFMHPRSDVLAFQSANWAEHGSNMDVLTDGQCDVLGTILKRKNLERGKKFLLAGMKKQPCPHSQALLDIGLAEIEYAQGSLKMSERFMGFAIGLREKVREEADQTQAMRQWCRVVRRAAALCHTRGDYIYAERLFAEAEAIARHKVWGSSGLRLKLWLARLLLTIRHSR